MSKPALSLSACSANAQDSPIQFMTIQHKSFSEEEEEEEEHL